MVSKIEFDGWMVIQVEIKFKDGEPVSEQAVYEHPDWPSRMRIRKIFVDSDGFMSEAFDVTNEVP